MQFSDTTNKQGLVEDTSYLIFGDSSSHTSDYALADVARNVNRWYQRVVSLILKADSRWEWDDTNKTDLPIAHISLVSGQQDYGITAATFLKVRKVDIKDSSGNNSPLKQIWLEDLRDRADADFLSTSGTPLYYRVQASSVFLYPKPNYSRTATATDWGLRIFYQRDVDEFAASDTTKVPGFAEPFHRILSLGAAYEYCLSNGLQKKAQALRQEIALLEAEIIAFYSNRNNDKVSLKIKREDYGQTALGESAGYWKNHPDRF